MKTMPAPRGYALIMVLMVLALIALGLGTVMFVVDSNLTSTRRILGETRCFYAVDSASRIASETVQAVAASLPPQSDSASVQQAIDDAKAAVCSIAGGCSGTPPVPSGLMPAGVTMTAFNVSVTPTSAFRLVAAGPFRNVVVRDSGMSVFIEGRDDGTGRECRVRETITSGTVSPFQFMMFATGNATFAARNNRSGAVPVYAAGNLCLGAYSGATFALTRAVAGGALAASGSGGCSPPPTGNGTVTVSGAPFSAAASADGVSTYANVSRLKLPIPTAPTMQGQNAGDTLSTRWLIDPVITQADTEAEERMRLAGFAHIRIIDGVWYVARDNFAWPGMPIYSDHPGSVTPSNVSETSKLLSAVSTAVEKVGLDDVRAVLESEGLRSPGDPWPPRRFSFYETNASGALDGDTRGVVSYGPLARDGTGALVPGFYPSEDSAAGTTCNLGGVTTLTPFNAAACTGADRQRALADGARSGFGDFSAKQTASSHRDQQAKILPINFNVAAFKEALQDTSPGELGSYFVDRKFNGAVFITSTWEGQLRGLLPIGGSGGGGTSSFANTINPEQAPSSFGGIVGFIMGGGGAKVPAPTTIAAVTAAALGVQLDASFFLPHSLCGTGSASAYAEAYAFSPCNGSGGGGGGASPGAFVNLAYGDSDGRRGTRPNAVRVYNGDDLRAFQPSVAGAGTEVTTKGLAIVTNLPLYVQGDFNTRRADTSSGNFPRALLAGNTITLLSNAWSDGANSWSRVMGSSYSAPAAEPAHTHDDGSATASATVSTSMMLRAALVTHWTRSPASQSIEELVRYLETYSAPIALRAAIYAAGHSVFRNDTQETSTLGRAPLDFKYDASLAQPTLQPPGIPRFMIGVAGKWKDTR